MSNYEIMILTNPQATDQEVKELLLSVLDPKNTKIEKLERTELAYSINKLTRASYYLINAKLEPQVIAELTRKLNINKFVIRSLIINLDSEKGMKPRKMRKATRKFDNRKRVEKQEESTKDETEQNEIKKERKPRTRKTAPKAE
ncbi:30S ribosomal protein S6 [[Mycoplasma] anseris]|uniref:Small ribosomal subunit protein bS6 n=1 Tax=[Mycoplasma] anseris TaxID=92400 RepID=A0A2Z4ND24_9BACT|nr:30S ribosomal protein S6 [[Mycoplasma] anseris]AWX69449.1 30S ribosomal protein S6 [[Mycoplasma] anseris]